MGSISVFGSWSRGPGISAHHNAASTGKPAGLPVVTQYIFVQHCLAIYEYTFRRKRARPRVSRCALYDKIARQAFHQRSLRPISERTPPTRLAPIASVLSAFPESQPRYPDPERTISVYSSRSAGAEPSNPALGLLNALRMVWEGWLVQQRAVGHNWYTTCRHSSPPPRCR